MRLVVFALKVGLIQTPVGRRKKKKNDTRVLDAEEK